LVRKEVQKCLQLSAECQEALEKIKRYEQAIAVAIVVLSFVFPLVRAVRVALQLTRLFRRIRENIDIVDKELEDLLKRMREIPLPQRGVIVN